MVDLENRVEGGPMVCPRDGVKLARVQIDGIELDKCHKCDGIWCDYGELERLRDSSFTGAEEVLEREYGNPKFEPGTAVRHMRCPRCGSNARLLPITVTFLTRVQVDRCNTCFGVWLDDTELNAIISEKRFLDEQYSPQRLRTFVRLTLAKKAKE